MNETKPVPADLEFYYTPIQERIRQILETNGPMTRAELVKQLNEARTTIYDNIMVLMTHNIVKKFSRPINSRGRPIVFFKLVDSQ